jgi:hypothetical protein
VITVDQARAILGPEYSGLDDWQVQALLCALYDLADGLPAWSRRLRARDTSPCQPVSANR